MAALGKSLVFYFKFWFEMQKLYEIEGADLEGLPEPDKTRRMAQAVGNKAYTQAADVLEACAEVLQERFEDIGECERITTAGKALEKNWSLAYGIWPKNSRVRLQNWKMQAGVEILKSEKPELIAWVWRQGGERSEETLAAMLADKVKARSQKLDLKVGIGSVALDQIAILPDNLDGFDVDREPLIEQVRLAFNRFTQRDLNLLYPK